MPRTPILEPNPAHDRILSTEFLTQQADYFESQATWGRSCGLLPPPAGERHVLADLDPPDVLQLPGIRAIGECGWPIVAEATDAEFQISPLDTRDLPAGRHRVYACLEAHRTPCGPIEEYDDPESGSSERAPVYRRARVVLAVGDERFVHRDWIAVADLVRERSAGLVRTHLDPAFHPPILDMRAWARPRNPLMRLAERVLPQIDDLADAPWLAALRAELQTLRALAEAAPAAVAFTQAQRCLGLVRAARLPFVPDGGLESFRYHPADVAAFLVALDESLDRSADDALYPETLCAGHRRYHRIDGEFVRQQALWMWSPPAHIEQASGLAVYFPRAVQAELPVVRYGRARDDATAFAAATFASDFAGPGCLVLFEDIKGRLERVFLAPVTPAMDLRLERRMLDGHALYYY